MVEKQPTMFGRYELLELIATGGMAQVYRARLHTAQGTDKEVVVKKVLPHLIRNQDFINMFIDEARISMPLNHANIVQVFDFGQVDEDYFMAMEYVHGHNLEKILARTREINTAIPLPICLFIASELAKGLEYAHCFRNSQDQPTGIIHRDVSPQNILIGFLGNVKLTDFGIAKAQSRIHQTRHGIIRGKACYLSPEQAECGKLDSRADQFSLAVVLFEMLTGVRPFEGENEVETLENVRQTKIQAPSTLRTDVPPEVDQAVMKALSRNPAERFDSTGSFQSTTCEILRGLAPGFTSSNLADWITNLFPTQNMLQHLMPQTTNHPDREKKQTNGPGLSREDILQMNTVVIKKESPQEQEPTRTRSFILLVFSLVFVLGAVAAIWTSWPSLAGLFGLRSEALSNTSLDRDRKQVDQPSNTLDAQVAQIKPARKESHNASITKPTRYGYLNLNAEPWALVELDGKRLDRHTPLFKIRVQAGKHNLRFFNPEIKLEKTIPVWVFPGQSKTVSVRLTDP